MFVAVVLEKAITSIMGISTGFLFVNYGRLDIDRLPVLEGSQCVD